MRIATVLMLGIGAALLAPRLVAPVAESHALGQAVGCPAALVLPEELNGLVRARDDDGAPCGSETVLMPTPLTLVEISAQAMGPIWTGTAAAPNDRIEKADRLLREAYAQVRDGLERITRITPPRDGRVGEIERTTVSR